MINISECGTSVAGFAVWVLARAQGRESFTHNLIKSRQMIANEKIRISNEKIRISTGAFLRDVRVRAGRSEPTR